MRLFHWLGHVLFDMDCAVHLNNATGAGYCKKCGRQVMEEDGRARTDDGKGDSA